MYLNPFENTSHKVDAENVIKYQLDGWIFESHCWVVVVAKYPHRQVCRWCGKKTHKDMQMVGGNTICMENPFIKPYVQAGEGNKYESDKTGKTP